jgi:hypothetical protein
MTSNFIEKQEETIYKEPMDVQPSVREVFTHETGQVLEAIGKMFVNIPPFNDHIDENTGRMLIAIAKKLKKK